MDGLLLGLQCTRCGSVFEGSPNIYTCLTCGTGYLDCMYDYDAIAARLDWQALRTRTATIWRWKELLLVRLDARVVTLGEGGTPLLCCERLARKIGVAQVWIKDAARAGLTCVVFCDAATPPEKLYQMLIYGAKVVRVDAPFAEVSRLLRDLIRTGAVDWYYCGRENPYRYEGCKTYAYEVVETLGKAPDVILHPAAGSLSIVKTWKGYQELQRIGLWSGKPPRLVAVQAAACAPIVEAYEAGQTAVTPVAGRPTIATAIASGDPGPMGALTLAALRASGGTAVAVNEDEIREATLELGREGILVEPSAATGWAAAKRLASSGWLWPEATVVIDVTGVGFKELSRIGQWLELPPAVPPRLDSIFDYLRA